MIRTLCMTLAIALACGELSATKVEDRRPLRWSLDCTLRWWLDRYDLPLNPAAPVIEFTQRYSHQTSDCLVPDLTVLADGTVLASCGTCEYRPELSYSRGIRIRHLHDRRVSRIDQKELQKLLHFVLVEKKLAFWDSVKVKRGVEQAWRDQPADTRNTLSRMLFDYELCVRIHVNRTVITVRWEGPWSRFDGLNAEALQGLVAVRDRLQSIRLVTVAGGPEVVTKWLTLANEALLSEYPDAEPFESTDLSWARLYLEPFDLKVRFFRSFCEKDRALIETDATLRIEDGDPPNVSVTLERHPFLTPARR